MMRLKVFSIFIFSIFNLLYPQDQLTGIILDNNSGLPLENVTVFNSDTNQISYSDNKGSFEIILTNPESEIVFFLEGYNLISDFYSDSAELIEVKLIPKIEELSEVIVRANLKRIFQIKRMEDVVGTRIYAGKKNEVILLDVSMANLASNNARQIYNQIPGLNI